MHKLRSSVHRRPCLSVWIRVTRPCGHTTLWRLLLDRPCYVSSRTTAATCFTERTVIDGSRLWDLDGARRNAEAIATEVVRLQGPPRRATVIRASRKLPGIIQKRERLGNVWLLREKNGWSVRVWRRTVTSSWLATWHGCERFNSFE